VDDSLYIWDNEYHGARIRGKREMEMEKNDVTNHPGWRNSPGVGDKEAVAALVGLLVAGSAALIGRVGRWGVLWR
jgi:hypothetical protein